jgi:hypothetical protein
MKKVRVRLNEQIINGKMKVVFTSFSSKNFFWRMYISKFVLDKGFAPVNPFMNFEYFLFDGADYNHIIKATNNIIKKCDEVWVFGNISDGVYYEIKLARKLGKKIKYFNMTGMPFQVNEIEESEIKYEGGFKPGGQ